MFKVRKRILAFAAIVCAIGCAEQANRPSPEASEVAPNADAKAAGKMLAALSVQGVRLEFREMQPGKIARMAYGTDADLEVLERLKELGGQGLMASEMFEALAPGQEIPIELLEAEARTTEELGSALMQPLDLPTSDQPGRGIATEEAGTDGDDVGVTSAALSSGENFYNSYCGNPFLPLFLFDKSICQTNKFHYASESWRNALPSMYWQSYVMNASESSGGSASYLMQWVTNNTWTTFASGWLAPGQWTWAEWPYTTRMYSQIDGFEGPVTPVYVHGYESFRNAPPALSHKFSYPANADREYANDLQGVTHDGVDTYWYSACKTTAWGGNCEPRIWRRDDDSSQIPDDLTWTSYPSKWSSNNLWNTSAETHYGALTWGLPANTAHSARIFVPISGSGNRMCHIGLFDPDLKTYWAPARLNVPDCAFVAYNPSNGLFYTLNNNKLVMYRITAKGYPAGGGLALSDAAPVTPLGGVADSTFTGLPLKDSYGNTFTFGNAWIQGGAFALPKPINGVRNKIYLVVQSPSTDGGPGASCNSTGTGNKCTGIYAVDVITGIVQSYTYIGLDGDYTKDVTNPFGGFNEEIEGISVTHLTGPSYYHPDCTAANCDTDFHLSILDNDDISNDAMIIRHYSASSLSGL